jgi:hypothetical protein
MFEKYLNPIFIETGTHYGGGVRDAINAGFKKIISIESKPEYYENCRKEYISYIAKGIVSLVLGKSEECLPEILANINCPVTFWLDAHPTGAMNINTATFPLRKEIEIICNHRVKDHIILIDDVRIFNSLGVSKEWVIETVLKNNPRYRISYETIREPEKYKDDVMVIKCG